MENNVQLIGYYGGDTIIAQSAWTSTYRDLGPDKISRIGNLIHSLWENGHETPFEKGIVHFLVDTDIASHIHLLKHRIASINGESARYKELKEDKFYLPKDWNGIGFDNEKFNAFTSETFRGYETWKQVLERYSELGNELYHQAIEDLTPVLGRKRAKESARFFKTYNSQIQADVMFNMRSFANFIKLRFDPEHAQKEICDIAGKMLELVENIDGSPFLHTINAIKQKLNI